MVVAIIVSSVPSKAPCQQMILAGSPAHGARQLARAVCHPPFSSKMSLDAIKKQYRLVRHLPAAAMRSARMLTARPWADAK